MNIVIEGIDNSGKSTLATLLARKTGFPTQPSEGPPRYPGEMDERLLRYASMDRYIFDRHPVVSQNIYKVIRTGKDAEGMREDLVQQFYDNRPLFIYCDPLGRGMSGHNFHDGVDTAEHLRQVDEGYKTMLTLYRDWAIKHAHILYRIGDDPHQVWHMVSAYFANRRVT
jgi:hypothetical protein